MSRHPTTEGQVFLEALAWILCIFLFVAGFGAAFQLQYRGYRKTLGRAGGFTAPSFSWQPDSGAGSRPKP